MAQTDDGILGARVCPQCTLLFVQADSTAQAIFYAVDPAPH